MTAIQALGVLIVRLWSLATIVASISVGIQYFFAVSAGSSNEYFVQSAIASAVWALAGLAAWFAAPWFARRLISEPAAISVSLTAFDLVALGSFLIGGFYLVEYVPQLATTIGAISVEMARSPEDADLAEMAGKVVFELRDLAAQALIVAVALFLTLRPRDFAILFSRLRYAGLSRPDEA